MKDFEIVAGVHQFDLFGSGFYFRGFHPYGPMVEHMLIQCNKHMAFRYRGRCETDPSFKQIIPYCLVTRKHEIFTVRRIGNGGEARLHDKYSVGIGGHMNPIPCVSPADMIKQNMLRELAEELDIQVPGQEDKEITADIVGMINIDDNPVGSVHVGVVYRVYLPADAAVNVRETDQLEGGFKSVQEAAGLPDLEDWSKVCLEQYFSKYAI